MKRVISSSVDNNTAVDLFMDAVSKSDNSDFDLLKLLYNAQKEMIEDYNRVPDEWRDRNVDFDTMYEEQKKFYNKYIDFARKCKDLLKTTTPGSGYGPNGMKQYKIYSILKNVDYNFPYGWR